MVVEQVHSAQLLEQVVVVVVVERVHSALVLVAERHI